MENHVNGLTSLSDYILELAKYSSFFSLPTSQFRKLLVDHGLIGFAAADLIEELGLLGQKNQKPFLGFLDSADFTEDIEKEPLLKVLICPAELGTLLTKKDCSLIFSKNPKYTFFEINNKVANARLRNSFANSISNHSVISPLANIANHSVIIEDGVCIDPNVTIYERVIVKRGAVIRSGAVIGSPGFEHKRGEGTILTVVHDGLTLIGEDAEVGPGSIIGQGFYNRPTIIGKNVKLDNLVSVAHASIIGDRTLIAAGAVIAGSVMVHEDVWIGPGAVISNNLELGRESFIALGSQVFKSVGQGERVIGSPARLLPYKQK
jgi:UDP-3-O-[3-hydroxymyristoyl] glucosamine N-acyltransferase